MTDEFDYLLHDAFDDFTAAERAAAKQPPGTAAVRHTVAVRRRNRYTTLSVLGAVLIAIPVVTYAANPRGNNSPPLPGASVTASGSPSATATANPTPSGVPTHLTACQASQLTGTVTDSGSTASQPFVVIALTNTSASACELTGYPGLTAAGHASSTPSVTNTLHISVTDGPTYERSDPGPQRVELPPNASASFALGTGTAYDGGAHMYSITRLQVTVPGDRTSIPVALKIAASGPAGQPIPVAVTAFVAGRSGPR